VINMGARRNHTVRRGVLVSGNGEPSAVAPMGVT
jgi:hypothetical protein